MYCIGYQVRGISFRGHHFFHSFTLQRLHPTQRTELRVWVYDYLLALHTFKTTTKMTVNDPNVGVAFALVCGAGLSTAIGASVVFFPRLVKLASRRVLAAALGLSAGVMTYVSFVEIFAKSQLAFEDSGQTPERAYVYATLCFFGGVVVMLVRSFVCLLARNGYFPGQFLLSNF